LRKIVIIGGGLAGLITSVQLVRAGISCTVIEKKSYPFHRVCGEYVSNEALPFLKLSGLFPKELNLPEIKYFGFSSVRGKTAKIPLDLGGFGISRYCFDNHLYRIALREGVTFQLNTEVSAINFADEQFEVTIPSGILTADVAIGSFGKRSKIDIQQNRSFITKRSPYVGVKYHVRAEHPENLISLHNFPGGYCGVSNVEGGVTNLCYLTHRENLRRFDGIPGMEENVLFLNPSIKELFSTSSFIFKKPEVINEVSFETKLPVENHILMAGDAAGMITPVCGNGMAIAIHSGKIVSEQVVEFIRGKIDRTTMEDRYRRAWNNEFRTRLWFGRNVQRLFGNQRFSSMAVGLARSSEVIARLIVRGTHGQPF
jgi:flavin-dependent dehydrogenase